MATEMLARLIISGMLILGFGGVVIALLVWPPESINTTVALLLGGLGTGYIQVIQYWFGVSLPKSTDSVR